MKTFFTPAAVLTAAASSLLHGELIVEESFTYDLGESPSIPVNGSEGGLGFGGSWSNPRNNPTVVSPGLTWGDLLTDGNSSRGAAWSSLIRPLGTSLSDANLLDNGATLWFSIIFDLTGQNIVNADLNISLGTAGFVPGTFGERENLTSGEGIGATHSRARIQGVYWQDNDADTIAERVENNSTTLIDGANENLRQALIVGRIDWGADESADETLTLYTPGFDLVLGDTPAMAAWSVPALDQSSFNQIALQYKDSPQFDEIRFGATSADVLPTAAGPAIDPVITSITAVGTDLYELTIVASADTEFAVVSSEILDLENGSVVSGLTQGSVDDPGTIGAGLDTVTTDENGEATLRMPSAPAKNFVRIQPPVAVSN